MTPAPFNLADHVLRRGAVMPARIALTILGPGPGETWSYARLISAVRGTARGLQDAGLCPGDRLLLRLGSTADFPVTYLGAIAAGVIPVPTSAQLTGPEISAIAREIAPKAIAAAPGIALPDTPALVLGTKTLRGFHRLPAAPYELGDPERPAYIIYTSGTSGRPRAVVHAHRSILGRTMMFEGWHGLTAKDRILHAGALNWTYTLGTGLLDPWTVGATALIPAAGTRSAVLPALLGQHDATVFAAAPGIYRQMLCQPMPPLHWLRHGLSAGERLPEAVRADWRKATGTDVHEAFGMSECSTFVSGSPMRPAPTGTLGYAQAGRRLDLRGPAGSCDPGTDGIIAIHRSDPGLMLGYLGQPEEMAARLDGDWFLTGDLGRVMADGAISYRGRADDMMNAGGYRVSPAEVEETLTAHPGIVEAAAVEVTVRPDVTVIAAFWSGPAALGDAALTDFVAERLARYKHPRLFLRIEHLPRGPNNKLDRRKLRQDWEAANGQT